MPEYDLVIRGGTIVDGTGIPRYKADVAVKEGKVARISGRLSPGGAKEIDASGCIVAPGAVDLHTHCDAQLNWDPYASLSGWHGVTSITIGECGFGFAPTKPRHRVLNMQMMKISGRPLHVAALQDEDDLTWVQSCRDKGPPAVIQQQCTNFGMEFKLAEYNLYNYMPSWIQPLVGTPEERAAKLRYRAVRAAMKLDVDEAPYNVRSDWSRVSVLEVVHPRNLDYDGKTITEMAKMTGKDSLDAFLDLALDEGLETAFRIPARDTADELSLRERMLRHPHSHISQSDGGAHTRFLTHSTWPVEWLASWIRDREIMSLEQAHHKMSALPAWFTDFKDRGTLRVGNWADIIVYDLDELGYVNDRPVFDTDFPGGERRLIQKPTGLYYTMGNGVITFEGTDCTRALPGRLLRSYEMVG